MKIFITERGAGSAGVRRIGEIAEMTVIKNGANGSRLRCSNPYDISHRMNIKDRRVPGVIKEAVETNEVVAQLRRANAIRRTDEPKQVNLVGLSCAGSILQLAKAIKESKPGEVVSAIASDPLFAQEIATWCRSTENALHYCKANGTGVTAVVQKRGRGRSGRRERLSRLH